MKTAPKALFIAIRYRGTISRPSGYESVILLNAPEESVVIPWVEGRSFKEAILRWAEVELAKESEEVPRV